MTPREPVKVPNVVRDVLKREGAYDFGLGVVLRVPRAPRGSGASASYRIEYRLAPALPGQPKAPRREQYSRELTDAFELAQGRFEEMQQRAGGTYVEYHTDVPFGEVVRHWFDSPHPRWGEQYPQKVRSLLSHWVLDDRITVHWRADGPPTPVATIPIGALTADHYNQALEHVRNQRAHRTYTEVHGLVVQVLKWALTNRYLRPVDGIIVDQLPMARKNDTNPDDGDDDGERVRPIAPEEIPPPGRLQALFDTARRLFGERTVLLLQLLAFAGVRISEALALRNDDRLQRGDDGCWRIEIRRQVHKAKPKTIPPKWGRRRWAFVPHFLTDALDRLVADTPPGGLLFPSPGRKVRNDAGVVERVGAGLYPYNNWRKRRWDKIAEATPGWPERDDWWPPDRGPTPPDKQSERRWQWSSHTLRHVCATYQLNVLRLDADDVAMFLGHRSGRQVWEMYVRVRPDLFGRAAEASRAAGDPRSSRT